MIKKSMYFLLITTVLSFGSVKNLSLNQAIEMLKKNNLELKISKFEEQMRYFETEVASGTEYGKLDLTVNAMRSNDALNVFGFKLQSREATFGDFGFASFDTSNPSILSVQPEDLNHPDARNFYQTKISYSIPIYTGGKIEEYKSITKSMHNLSKLDSHKILNEKIYQVKKAFSDISLVNSYIKNLSKITANINKLENIVKAMGEEGFTREVDLLEVNARKAEADNMLRQAKLNKDLAYQFLSFLLNEEITSIENTNYISKINLDNIQNNNLDIQRAEMGVSISKKAIEIERANYLPMVGGFAEYGSADNAMLNDFTEKDSYTVGIQLKWNVFNGGIDKANLEKAKINHLKSANQLALAKNGIGLKIKELRTEILSKDSQIESYKKQLKFATRVYTIYSEKYKEGLSSISDVLMKQSKELQFLLQLITTQNSRNSKILELHNVVNNQ